MISSAPASVRRRWGAGSPAALALLAVLPTVAAIGVAGRAAAQGPGGFALRVGVAEAIDHQVRPTLSLSGTVETRRDSLVATEVSGIVAELTARQGDAVRRGAPIVRLRRKNAELELDGARADLAAATARQRIAELRRKRAEELFADQVVPSQVRDDAVSEFEAVAGEVESLQAEVARRELDLERTTVRAPFDGVVVSEHTAPGEWVSAGDPVATVVDVGDLEITLEIPEQHYAGLAKSGEEVPVEIAALPGRSFVATVRAVVPQADPQARTFPIKLALPNPDGRIGIGMLARVRLPVGELRPSVMVPKDAVVSAGPSRTIFVIGDNDQVRPVAVQLGASAGSWVAVSGDGVAAGDRVVVQGNERLSPGQQVLPQVLEVARP